MPVSGIICFIYLHPLFISALCISFIKPGCPTIQGELNTSQKYVRIDSQTVIIKISVDITFQHRISNKEDPRFYYTRKSPCLSAVCCKSKSSLSKLFVIVLNCLQPIAILFGLLRSTAIEGSLAASPTMFCPFASTFT